MEIFLIIVSSVLLLISLIQIHQRSKSKHKPAEYQYRKPSNYLDEINNMVSASKASYVEENGSQKVSKISVSATQKERFSNSTILIESQIPEWCSMGNLIFEKKYDEAIELGIKLLAKDPESAGVHINLMDAYYKARDNDAGYFDKATYHAKMAMIYGHNTGYAQKRLVINLEKMNLFNQSIQLCDIILSERFNFSSHGHGTKSEYENRKNKLMLKLAKSQDSKSDHLFSELELDIIYSNIELSNQQEAENRRSYEESKIKFDEWYSEEESNKRVNKLRDALYGNNRH